MRLTFLGVAMMTGTLMAAGSGLALVEAIGVVGTYAQAQHDATCDYAAYVAQADACQAAYDAALPVAGPAIASLSPTAGLAIGTANAAQDAAAMHTAEALGKAEVVKDAATAIAANLQGQAQAGADLAVAAAHGFLATADAITGMERQALLSGTVITQTLIESAVEAKQETEVITLYLLQGAPEDPQGAVAGAGSEATALAVTTALENQAAVNAWLNAVVEA